MHIVHCRICKAKMDIDKMDDSEWVVPSRNWYYHTSCYNDFAKKKGAIKENDITIEISEEMWFSCVYDYLKKDLKMSINFTKFQSQWQNFIKKGMTPKGIYFSLRYFYEVAKGDITKSENGIGIVPFIYTEGTSYWGERNLKDKGICDRIEQQIMASRQIQYKTVTQKRTTVKNRKDISFDMVEALGDD